MVPVLEFRKMPFRRLRWNLDVVMSKCKDDVVQGTQPSFDGNEEDGPDIGG